jgi:hypothetical protein
MKIEDIIAGLQIIAKTAPGYSVDVEHDAIFAGDASQTAYEDAEKLMALGWIVSEGDRWMTYT